MPVASRSPGRVGAAFKESQMSAATAPAPIDPQNVTAREATLSLFSCVCPACGDTKGKAKTLCGRCYHRLPRDIAKALYSRVGQGYEQAIGRAFLALGRVTFTLAKESKR
jgi:hypothetical protein